MMSLEQRPYDPSTLRRRVVRIARSLLLIGGLALVAGVIGALRPFPMSIGQIQPWSFALGQVAFGLTAAFLAFILPQMSEFRQWWETWRGRIPDRRPVLAKAMVDDLKLLLEHPDLEGRISHSSRHDLAARLDKWTDHGEPANLVQIQKAGLMLRQLLENEAAWFQILDKAGLKDRGHIGSDSLFRSMLIAESVAAEFQDLYEKLEVNTTALCILTFGLGAVSLSPDPFFFGVADFYIGNHLSPDFDHQIYPMLGLVFPAMVALVSMARLGFIISLAYGRLKMLDPRRHDSTLWTA